MLGALGQRWPFRMISSRAEMAKPLLISHQTWVGPGRDTPRVRLAAATEANPEGSESCKVSAQSTPSSEDPSGGAPGWYTAALRLEASLPALVTLLLTALGTSKTVKGQVGREGADPLEGLGTVSPG